MSKKNLRAIPLIGLILLLLASGITPASARGGRVYPDPSFYLGVEMLYERDYKQAEREFKANLRSGVATAQSRWIDSVCYQTMLGEVYFQQGLNSKALVHYNNACQLYLAYPKWMKKIRQDTPPLKADPLGSRRIANWGRSTRNRVVGKFPPHMLVAQGQMDNSQVLKHGGVFKKPEYWKVDPFEIVRCTALAIRRRNQILGVLGPHDGLSRKLVDVLSAGNASSNTWMKAWDYLLVGIAHHGLAQNFEASTSLKKSVLIAGQYDHPLTGVAFLELGDIAFEAGNFSFAQKSYLEASFAAYTFEDWGTLNESLQLAAKVHALTVRGLFKPLLAASAWAKKNRFQLIYANTQLSIAEGLMQVGSFAKAKSVMSTIRKERYELPTSSISLRREYNALRLEATKGLSTKMLVRRDRFIKNQHNGSLRTFQIQRANLLYDSGQGMSTRIAVNVYKDLLADPTPKQWLTDPKEGIAFLKSENHAAYERWFLAAWDRGNAAQIVAVSEQIKRRRFYASLSWGGRLFSLRKLMSTDPTTLNTIAKQQRQTLLEQFPQLRELSFQSKFYQEKLLAKDFLVVRKKSSHIPINTLKAYQKNLHNLDLMLLNICLSENPAPLLFPIIKTSSEIQTSLKEKQALVLFQEIQNNLYGVMLTKKDSSQWFLGNNRNLKKQLVLYLQSLGNLSAKRKFTVTDLADTSWKKLSEELYKAIFKGSRFAPEQTSELIIIPDGLLWHLPFETMTINLSNRSEVLLDITRLRYAPFASVAVGDKVPFRKIQTSGLLANELRDRLGKGSESALIDAFQESLPHPVVINPSMRFPSNLAAPMLDQLIVLNSKEISPNNPYAWNPLIVSKSKSGSKENLLSWLQLPTTGPERVVMTAVRTVAERSLKTTTRRLKSLSYRPGEDLFLSTCGLMANGARTILLSRWSTEGQANLDATREFVQELPHTPASESWQRAVQLTRESTLAPELEPRLNKLKADSEAPKADHPFFWAGYILVDTGYEKPPEKKPEEKKPNDKKLPPGEQPTEKKTPQGEQPTGKKIPPGEQPAEKQTPPDEQPTGKQPTGK